MKKMYMIGNAHVDPVWLWRWQEGFQETKATFRSALDRMNEYEDFIFTSSSAAFYEWIENNDTAMFDEIKKRIKEGRWIICGGWWVQPDCNIPSGESFARQGLIGQGYFIEKFGVEAKVGYNVDSFGHNGMLPQILRKSGMESYVFMRPNPEEKGLPSRLFIWESDDGSRVNAFRIPFEYCTFDHLENHILHCKTELKASFNHLMCFYGVGNHGGGPTKENIETIRALQADKDEVNIVFSSPNEFFEEVKTFENQLPTIHDDLQHHASGCYSVHSDVKKQNRLSENSLLMAEKFSVLANCLTDQTYPNNYKQAWKNVLFNQFHDILAGTSIEAAYTDARDLYGEALSIASRNLNYALQSISWNIKIEEEAGMRPIVVFNPHSWPLITNIEVEEGIFGNYTFPEVFVVENASGQEVPSQIVQPIAKIPSRKRISFLAELPPFGYTTFKLRSIEPTDKFSVIEIKENSMENDLIKLTIDEKTGGISGLYDKEKQFNVFKEIGAIPIVIEDLSDTWGHGKLRFDDKIGEFEPVKIKKIEEGPVKSVIRVISQFNMSTITQDFILYRGIRKVEVKVKVNWQEKYKTLKLNFPVNMQQRKTSYEIPFGHISREANGEEEPMQNWIDVSGTISKDSSEIYGLSILNDAKYSADVTGHIVNLTVLRSPIYAHHIPHEPDLEDEHPIIDQGVQYFTYALLPHTGGWEDGMTVRQGWELNQVPPMIVESHHEGTLKQEGSFLQIDKENIILSAMKQAEDNDDIVIRLYETNNEATEVTVSFPLWNQSVTLQFSKSEVKTIRFPRGWTGPIIETNFLEQPINYQKEEWEK